IHGALHLLGYNHEEILEEKIMFSKTEKILNKVISE
ncbi:MAG: rRNA maturation RNAse YbeY, partial [SAR202 cluster bacterium]|nr:rRNA maturation RNAse YbeY [SAR202 cluster bacterium]